MLKWTRGELGKRQAWRFSAWHSRARKAIGKGASKCRIRTKHRKAGDPVEGPRLFCIILNIRIHTGLPWLWRRWTRCGKYWILR